MDRYYRILGIPSNSSKGGVGEYFEDPFEEDDYYEYQ